MSNWLLRLVAVGLVPCAFEAQAEYPEKPVALVVPYSAGGPTDKVGRDFAETLGRVLGGKTVIVENDAGAGGNIGAAKVARAAPDGYTLLLHDVAMATAPSLYRKLGFNPVDDFEPLGLVNEVPMTLIARPGFPAATLTELKRTLAEHPGKYTMANAGIGSAAHLCALLLQQALKVDVVNVPYKGTAPAMGDLLGGQVDLMCDQTTNTSAQIAAKTVRVYGVTTTRRVDTPALAAVPTLDEGGLTGFHVAIWHGLYAPKGTPPAIVAKLSLTLKAVLKDASFVQRERALGAVIVDDARTAPDKHRTYLRAETQRWGPVLRSVSKDAN